MQAQPRTQKSQHGFTIVELMVALVVSLLAATGIYTIFSQSSAQQSRTAETQDMWQQARIAMAMIERDVRMVGFGMNPSAGCSRILAYDSRLGGTGFFETYPIQSVDQSSPDYDPSSTAGASTQSITLRIGTDGMGAVPVTFIDKAPSNTAANFHVTDVTNIHINDLLLVRLATGICALVQVTNDPLTSGFVVAHTQGGSYFNTSGGLADLGLGASPQVTITVDDMDNARIYNLGQGETEIRYTISDDSSISSTVDETPTLRRSTRSVLDGKTTTQPIARGIVALQVRYGYDENNDGRVDAYDVWDAAKVDFARTVRIAMLARSTMPDRSYRGPTSYNLLGANYVVPSSNGDGCVNGDCRPYRHQLFQTEIPLRNMIIGQMNQ